MNHSCQPNVRIDVDSLRIVAARDVAAGAELTFFYPSTEWELAQPFICVCGTDECLGPIMGAKFLSDAIVKRYFINDFILQMHSQAADSRSSC